MAKNQKPETAGGDSQRIKNRKVHGEESAIVSISELRAMKCRYFGLLSDEEIEERGMDDMCADCDRAHKCQDAYGED